MTTCLGKSCSFGLLCVHFVNVYEFVCAVFFPFEFEGGMWDLIVLIPDHYFSIYFRQYQITIILMFPINIMICLRYLALRYNNLCI